MCLSGRWGKLNCSGWNLCRLKKITVGTHKFKFDFFGSLAFAGPTIFQFGFLGCNAASKACLLERCVNEMKVSLSL